MDYCDKCKNWGHTETDCPKDDIEATRHQELLDAISSLRTPKQRFMGLHFPTFEQEHDIFNAIRQPIMMWLLLVPNLSKE